jgi:hypothetical protein
MAAGEGQQQFNRPTPTLVEEEAPLLKKYISRKEQKSRSQISKRPEDKNDRASEGQLKFNWSTEWFVRQLRVIHSKLAVGQLPSSKDESTEAKEYSLSGATFKKQPAKIHKTSCVLQLQSSLLCAT